MAFPEGQRSPDGHLIDFKGGIFSMAVKTGVPIVPLSLSHTNAVFPSNALFPVQAGAGKLHVHVHEPIESKGRTDAELAELVRKAFLSELPIDHLPVNMSQEDLIVSSAVDAIKIASSSHHVLPSKEHDLHHHIHHEKHSVRHIVTTGHHQLVSAHHENAKSHVAEDKTLPLYAIDVKEEVVQKL